MTTKPTEEPEYISSATLMVLGTDLRPRDVSTVLGMRPSQAWAKGERMTFRGSVIGESLYEWGGWKKSLPASQEHRLLSQELEYWARRLNNKVAAFSQLASLGFHCSLRCYVGTSGRPQSSFQQSFKSN